MTKLELINKCIKEVKNLLRACNEEVALNSHLSKDDEWIGYKNDLIKQLKESLKLIVQIKTDLEAWESIKRRLKINAFVSMDSIKKDHPYYRVIEKALDVKMTKLELKLDLINNKCIKEVKLDIRNLNNSIANDSHLPEDNENVMCKKQILKRQEEYLNLFVQIKNDLETWEIIKKRLKINAAFVSMKLITIDHPYYRVIEKALEVKNE